jgi:hypothetical protein
VIYNKNLYGKVIFFFIVIDYFNLKNNKILLMSYKKKKSKNVLKLMFVGRSKNNGRGGEVALFGKPPSLPLYLFIFSLLSKKGKL